MMWLIFTHDSHTKLKPFRDEISAERNYSPRENIFFAFKIFYREDKKASLVFKKNLRSTVWTPHSQFHP